MATGWAKEKGKVRSSGKVQGTQATVVQAPGCAMPPIGSLSNDDDDGNDNCKDTISLGPVYMEVGDHR